MAHEPGPWFARENKGTWSGWVIAKQDDPAGDTITALAWVRSNLDEWWNGLLDAEANARLMAAAPQMLEALQYTLRTIDEEIRRRGTPCGICAKFDHAEAPWCPYGRIQDAIEAAIGERRVANER